DRREVQQRDALVIAREQPRLDAVSVVQIVMRGYEQRAAGHGYLVCTWGNAWSDLTYSISSSSCSSDTRPWKVGMIGWKPAVTFAAGCRIDSRRYALSTVTVSPLCSETVLPKSPSSTGPRPCAAGRWLV